MKNELINLDHRLIKKKAEEYFVKMCGPIDWLKDMSKSMKDQVKNEMRVKVIASSFGLEVINHNSIIIEGKSFSCNILSQIDRKHVIGIYAYMLTIGEMNLIANDLLEQYYIDAWGTAYVDASREILKLKLKEKAYTDFNKNNPNNENQNSNHPNLDDNKIWISDSFGPGYYGMDISLVDKFFHILDGDKIGIRQMESGIMVPVKSNVGFFLVTDKKIELPSSDCKSCLGVSSGCDYCNSSKRSVDHNGKGKDELVNVTFLPQNIQIEAKKEENILDIAIRAGISIDGTCNHTGRCGKCKVKITIGKTSDIEAEEKNVLTEEEIKKGYRLACKVHPYSDVRVFVTESEKKDRRKTELIYMPQDFKVDPYQNQMGIAFDIGTTSVVALLWDRRQGKLIDVAASINPQRNYGADVISRITYCSNNLAHLKKMQALVIECCNQLIEELCSKNHIDVETIHDYTMVGNTTMSHLFLGANIEGLTKAPFLPSFIGEQEKMISSLGLKGNHNAHLYLLPGIAGHVGSDITAGILAMRLQDTSGVHIIVDIGTNGEIVVSNNGRIFVCSTAAGPAFEGAGIQCGMRASRGAIEGVKIKDGEVLLTVIDQKRPIGICGSGLIDAISEMLHAGIIDETGRILDTKTATMKNIHPELISRIREYESNTAFVLFSEIYNQVVITQEDIRQIQLAKAAIYAGILALLEIAKAKIEMIDSIFLAGTFGNYIKKESAVRIGLIQNIGLEKIIPVGNLAGTGASMALLSRREREKATQLVKKMKHIDLGKNEIFKREYIHAMNFKVEEA